MKLISRCLANRTYREAIVAGCFSSGLSRFHAYKFKSFSAKLIDWRWASVIHFVEAVGKLEEALLTWWDFRSFQGSLRAAQPARDDDDDAVDLNTLDSTLRDLFCWKYMKMLLHLLKALCAMSKLKNFIL